MKTLKLKTNSWHYKVAEFGGNMSVYGHPYGHDICSYSRKVIRGIFALIAAILISVMTTMFISYVVVETVLSIAFSFYTGHNMFTEIGVIGNIIMIAMLVVFCIDYFGKKISAYKERRYHENLGKPDNSDIAPDSFTKSVYKAYKEKYCSRVEFE